MPGGRPHKFTPETVDRIITAVKAGLSYRVAAEAAGITYETFNEWRKGNLPQGKNKAERKAIDELHSEFSDGLTQARALGVGILHKRIHEAGKKDWRANAYLLERIDPDTYGRQRLEITGRDGGPLEITEVVDARILKIAEKFNITPDAVRARMNAAMAGDDEE